MYEVEIAELDAKIKKLSAKKTAYEQYRPVLWGKPMDWIDTESAMEEWQQYYANDAIRIVIVKSSHNYYELTGYLFGIENYQTSARSLTDAVVAAAEHITALRDTFNSALEDLNGE